MIAPRGRRKFDRFQYKTETDSHIANCSLENERNIKRGNVVLLCFGRDGFSPAPCLAVGSCCALTRRSGSATDLCKSDQSTDGEGLKIKEVEAEDAGTYICKATNGFGSINLNYTLIVISKY
ncbi:hypothetical protein scyTo_0012874 [Scyliorhinus torazame]|uniref:Immunoglobulin I-set domain-containing protein n=1 Tax=Scyliorhinus torazame TaxID=75743 RepID=A0A401NK36_SCYTO|nr:hypothetical protein [Scyliorhinus torazame]